MEFYLTFSDNGALVPEGTFQSFQEARLTALEISLETLTMIGIHDAQTDTEVATEIAFA